MYNEQLEKLIEMALMDGELTEKEKQVLFKKAEVLGVDLDEFEMVLEARLYEKQKSMEQEQPKVTTSPKSNKLGDVKKCPSCGANAEAFQAICSDCGHEFINVDISNSAKNLYNDLMKVDEDEKNSSKNNSSSVLGMISGEFNEEKREKRIYEKKSSIVSAFPVPNSKEDILEFFIMAVSEGAKKSGFIATMFSGVSPHESKYIQAWRAKAEQVLGKAQFSLKNDKKLLDEINEYAKKLKLK